MGYKDTSGHAPNHDNYFVTPQSRVLAGQNRALTFLADGKIIGPQNLVHAKELENMALNKTDHAKGERKILINTADDKINWEDDLPERFQSLEERHFPPFITFDRV